MNIARFLISFIFLPSSMCLADRQLERSEILQILQSLTAQQNKTTWIPSGILTATHEEYKIEPEKNIDQVNSPKESRFITEESVRFDGERFYWQIDAVSDPISRQASTFDFFGNAKRIFVWDGQRYSTYYRPVNLAIITDAEKLKIVPAINGPLTAGFIPWGLGIYSYQALSSASVSGTEKFSDSQRQIQLNVKFLDGPEMIFTLDPEKNYAVLSYQFKNTSNSISVNTYGNFQLVANKWIPQTIMIEQYKNSVASTNLIANDLWNFTSISACPVSDEWFQINYENDALIEYHTQLASESLIYRHYKPVSDSDKLNSDSLLIEKFDFDAQTGFSHDCASAAIKYTTSRLGKKAGSDQLAGLSQDPNGTNLYTMKKYCENLGLYCRAVKMDISNLRNLTNCEAILHIPGKNHYLVLGNIDNAYVRVIDLSARKFLDHFSMNDFKNEWAQGTVLIVSSQPLKSEMQNIDNLMLRSIFGAGYSCTRLLQNAGTFPCTDNVLCGGTCIISERRLGCAPDVSGTCTMSIMPRYQESECIPNPLRFGDCTVAGKWKIHYMRACE